MRARRLWLIPETLLAFAIPAYLWLWGMVGLPLWLWGAADAEAASIWSLVSLIGGALGMIGLVGLLTAAISREPVSVPGFSALAILSGCGLFAVWVTMTSHFEAFSLDPFTLIAGVAPTLCTVHLLVLCARLIERSG